LQYLREHKLEQDGFQKAAVQVLPSDAPLLKYIAAENQPAAMREE
jgi:hypothetical protein